jgi:hypothetical protein
MIMAHRVVLIARCTVLASLIRDTEAKLLDGRDSSSSSSS